MRWRPVEQRRETGGEADPRDGGDAEGSGGDAESDVAIFARFVCRDAPLVAFQLPLC